MSSSGSRWIDGGKNGGKLVAQLNGARAQETAEPLYDGVMCDSPPTSLILASNDMWPGSHCQSREARATRPGSSRVDNHVNPT